MAKSSMYSMISRTDSSRAPNFLWRTSSVFSPLHFIFAATSRIALPISFQIIPTGSAASVQRLVG